MPDIPTPPGEAEARANYAATIRGLVAERDAYRDAMNEACRIAVILNDVARGVLDPADITGEDRDSIFRILIHGGAKPNCGATGPEDVDPSRARHLTVVQP